MNSLTNIEKIINKFFEKVENSYLKNIIDFFNPLKNGEDINFFLDVFKIAKKLAIAANKFIKEMMEYYVQMIDEILFSLSIVKENFISKGFSKTHLLLEVGEIEFSRRRFNVKENKEDFLEQTLSSIENIDENLKNKILEKTKGNGAKDIYLLDYILNIDNTLIKGISNNLLSKILSTCTEMSYRKASTNIEKYSSIPISHTKLWSLLQNFGDKIREYQNQRNELNKENQLETKNNKTEIIFKEADGVELVLQGKDRKEQYENYKKKHNTDKVPKRVRNATFYLISAYDGKEQGVGKEKKLHNKIVVGGFEFPKLVEIFNTELDGYFDRKKVKYEILNTDGESTLSKLVNDKTYYQADTFHILDKIDAKVEESEDREVLKKLYYENKPQEILDYIESLKYKCGGEEIEVKKLEELYSYFEKRKDNLLPYFKKEGMQEYLDKLSKETKLEYSNLGCQESINYQTICQRMKKRRMSWSNTGANNMITTTTFLMSVNNKDKVENLQLEKLEELQESIEELNEKYINEIEEKIKQNKKELKENKKLKKNRKIDLSSVHNGQLPSFLKEIGKLKSINNLNNY